MKNGESQQTDPIPLDQPLKNEAPFRAGANDEFKVGPDHCAKTYSSNAITVILSHETFTYLHFTYSHLFNSIQVFIDIKKLGKLYKLRIGHNNDYPNSGWFLDKVIIIPR